MALDNFPYRLDKTAFAVAALDDESDDKEYWFSQTPHERLLAVEYLRQVTYGYDPTTARLQRVFEIVEFPSRKKSKCSTEPKLKSSKTRIIKTPHEKK